MISKKKNQPISAGELVDAINALDYNLKMVRAIVNCVMLENGYPLEFIKDVNLPVKNMEEIAEKFSRLQLATEVTNGKNLKERLGI